MNFSPDSVFQPSIISQDIEQDTYTEPGCLIKFTLGIENLHLECLLAEDKAKSKQSSTGIFNSESNADGSFKGTLNQLYYDRYKFVRQIGKGQFSVLFLAHDTFGLYKKVAIKVYHSQYAAIGENENNILTLLQSKANLTDWHIVDFIGSFSTKNDHFCLIMGILDPSPIGFRFAKFASEKRIKKIKSFTVQMLSALLLLDKNRIIHGDLKPDNILFAKNGKKITLIDFGNSISADSQTLKNQFGNVEIQTLVYRAPEVIYRVPFGTQIDMWSLGCIIAELYTGSILFPVSCESELYSEILKLVGKPVHLFQSSKIYDEERLKKYGRESRPEKLAQKIGCNNGDFIYFLLGLLDFDPETRFSVKDCLKHNFLSSVFPFNELMT